MSARRPHRAAPLLWLAPALAFLALFFVAPLGGNLLRSLTEGQAQDDAAFYYAKLLTDEYYLSVMWETIRVSLITTLICLAVGYPVALFLVRHAGRWHGVLLFLLVAPLLTSIIMRTFGWRVLLARRGLLSNTLLDLGLIARPLDLLNDPVSVFVGLVHVLVPFMVLSIAAVLQGIDRRLEESARVLGASRLRAFLSVTLPLSVEGMATGAILVFMLTNGSFVTMLLLGGGKVVTMPLLIYQQFTMTQDLAFASAMGNVLLLAALACLALQVGMLRRRGMA